MKSNINIQAKLSSGFTLVEILVALAILSISLSAVLYVVNQNTNNLSQLKDKTFAHWVAMNKASEFRIKPDLIKSSRQLSGQYSLAQREWQWNAQLQPTEDNDLYRLVIDVYDSKESDKKLTTLKSFVSFALQDAN